MHFTVAVMTNSMEGFYDALAPFQENNMGTCPKEYMEFHNAEEEYLKVYEEGEDERIVTPDGRLLSQWDKEFKVVLPTNIPFSEYDYDYGKLKAGEYVTHRIPEELERRNVPFKEIYSTFEEFMEEYYGFQGRDEEMGAYGYWYNPDARWDWYQLGGRWRGLLLVKEDVPHLVGAPGVFGDDLETREVPEGYKWVDVAKIKDIEWDMMKKLAREEAIKNWDKVMQIEDESERKLQRFLHGIHDKDTKESFVERASRFATFAVLTPNGEWYEKEYGYNEKEWDETFFDEFIKDADPELYLAVVDCHI